MCQEPVRPSTCESAAGAHQREMLVEAAAVLSRQPRFGCAATTTEPSASRESV
jgi:hypothetical protein